MQTLHKNPTIWSVKHSSCVMGSLIKSQPLENLEINHDESCAHFPHWTTRLVSRDLCYHRAGDQTGRPATQDGRLQTPTFRPRPRHGALLRAGVLVFLLEAFHDLTPSRAARRGRRRLIRRSCDGSQEVSC